MKTAVTARWFFLSLLFLVGRFALYGESVAVEYSGSHGHDLGSFLVFLGFWGAVLGWGRFLRSRWPGMSHAGNRPAALYALELALGTFAIAWVTGIAVFIWDSEIFRIPAIFAVLLGHYF